MIHNDSRFIWYTGHHIKLFTLLIKTIHSVLQLSLKIMQALERFCCYYVCFFFIVFHVAVFFHIFRIKKKTAITQRQHQEM